jgi:uncharacterized protein YndB with AHSA1/START domain
MTDIANWLNDTHRGIGGRRLAAGEGRSVLLRRSYDAPIGDVWDACTDPDRLKRWFLPVSGDLRFGGAYQLEGSAGGEILRCEQPSLLTVTWVYRENPAGEVELRLSPGVDGDTVFELEHAGVLEGRTVADFALAVGPGWDLALVSLGIFLRGKVIEDPAAWENSPEVQEFSRQTTYAWTTAVEAAGASSRGEIATAVEASLANYAPDTDYNRNEDKSK